MSCFSCRSATWTNRTCSAIDHNMAQPVPTRLFISRMCPYAQRTTLALADAGIIDSIQDGKYGDGLELIHIDLRNKPQWYLDEINPKGKVPALEITFPDTGASRILLESAPLAQFLADTFRPSAMTPLQRFDAAMVTDAMGSHFVPAFYGLLREKDPEKQPEAAAKLVEAIRTVAPTLHLDGPFALGDAFSWAEVMSASFLMRLPVLKHYRDFDMPTDEPAFERFQQWIDAVSAHPTVQATTASVDDIVEFYKVMAV
ncbi:Glutathione S-transferase U1 [Allomyces arbusculus]|nr:Glutathione S-transferase U1 [Allomyces arbusculus]